MRKLLATLCFGAVAAAATPVTAQTASLTFQIVGDTFSQPYTITNNSSPGLRVTGFGVTLVSPYGFDTVNGGFGIDNATAFAPTGGTAATTGYTGPASFADGSSSINFTFSNFDPGESFSWLIDVDRPTVATVFGNQLIGSTGYADFSNGLRGTGTFVALGGNGSQFQINAFVPTPGVPEPATWALMIAGFGATGAALRHRRARGVLALG